MRKTRGESKSRAVSVVREENLLGKDVVVRPHGLAHGLFLEDVLLATSERTISLQNHAFHAGARRVIFPPNDAWTSRSDDE